ncbi:MULTISPECIES: DUF3221 domain-containing protein [Bacillus]|uniref:DUF3221 domain-containing protein n=1 Tax=Bacillus TaxID=1386 RepID=UPI000B4A0B0D|nr:MULTISPECIES: DUF3221 domain-containing protein [Bacillus]MDH4420781.1 DUF3221 domain-containing protein [Bacillus cereus]PER22978.1 DUF3221 domain-containing protein [Bacillus cereus]PGX10082.1 DUF3221 domain-containing protein [Bacillus sp. AFS033286]PGZ76041.1 DUF3221 domain-containing protein [Bacillus sp. AFS029637]
MKRNSLMAYLYVFLIILSACTSPQISTTVEQTVTKEGYVILKNDRVYFIGDKTFEMKVELQNYIEQQMNKEHPSDIVLSFKDKHAYNQLKTGNKIKVWSSQIIESYPAKMIVEKFEIVDK